RLPRCRGARFFPREGTLRRRLVHAATSGGVVTLRRPRRGSARRVAGRARRAVGGGRKTRVGPPGVRRGAQCPCPGAPGRTVAAHLGLARGAGPAPTRRPALVMVRAGPRGAGG